MNISCKLTVFFEDPFWVGVFERTFNEQLDVYKIVFGSEPKDNDVYQFILSHFTKITFSNSINNQALPEKKVNPKRLSKKISKELNSSGVGTKSQQLLKLEQENRKIERKHFSREMKEQEKERKFQLKQVKRKEKHRGH